jgi:hypothetical protein
MTNGKVNSKGFFLVLNLIHAALISGQIFFGLIAYYLVTIGAMVINPDETVGIFRIIVPLISILSIVASYMFFRMQLNNAKSKPGLSEKLMTYRTALIVKWAFLEAPSLLAIVGYLLTGNRFFIIIAGLIIIIFLIHKPSKNTAAFELELSRNERDKIDKPDGAI